MALLRRPARGMYLKRQPRSIGIRFGVVQSPLLCCKACSLSGFQKEEVSLVIPVLANALQLRGSQRHCDSCSPDNSQLSPFSLSLTHRHSLTHMWAICMCACTLFLSHTYTHSAGCLPPLGKRLGCRFKHIYYIYSSTSLFISPYQSGPDSIERARQETRVTH